jgi:hypothetical protein
LKDKIDESAGRARGACVELNRRNTVIWTSSVLGIRIVRTDYWRPGRATLRIGGDEIETPFELRDRAELRMELAN